MAKQYLSVTLLRNFKSLNLGLRCVIISGQMNQVPEEVSWLAGRCQAYDQRLEVLSLCLQHVTVG